MSKSGNTCGACGEKLAYNSVYDARYCPSCNVWTEKKCCDGPNAGCPFQCWRRPERPVMDSAPTVRALVFKCRCGASDAAKQHECHAQATRDTLQAEGRTIYRCACGFLSASKTFLPHRCQVYAARESGKLLAAVRVQKRHLDDGAGSPACGAAARGAVLVDEARYVTCYDCREGAGLPAIN